jgi:hypothetical protein
MEQFPLFDGSGNQCDAAAIKNNAIGVVECMGFKVTTLLDKKEALAYCNNMTMTKGNEKEDDGTMLQGSERELRAREEEDDNYYIGGRPTSLTPAKATAPAAATAGLGIWLWEWSYQQVLQGQIDGTGQIIELDLNQIASSTTNPLFKLGISSNSSNNLAYSNNDGSGGVGGEITTTIVMMAIWMIMMDDRQCHELEAVQGRAVLVQQGGCHFHCHRQRRRRRVLGWDCAISTRLIVWPTCIFRGGTVDSWHFYCPYSWMGRLFAVPYCVGG